MGAKSLWVALASLTAAATLTPGWACAQSSSDTPEPAVVVRPDATPDAAIPARPLPAPAARPVETQPAVPTPLKGVVKELRSGPLLIHGNFCGIGNRPGAAPIDPLDAACMRHDACTRAGKLPTCACDDRLRVEATEVARDPRTPPDVQVVATATAAAMAVLICKTGGGFAVPILPAPR